MKTIYIIIIIAAIIAILITFAVVFYRYFTEKINNILSSLNGAIEECNSKYKTKHELLLKMIEIIETKYKVESKVFEDVKSIKEEDLIKKEKTMNKCYKEILQVKEDNKKLEILNSKLKDKDYFSVYVKDKYQYSSNSDSIIPID